LLEHARLAQWDILEFSRNSKHKSPGFPDGYWPKTPGKRPSRRMIRHGTTACISFSTI